MLLCKMEPEDSTLEPVDQLATHLVSFFHKGVDPIVFVNMSGQILSANEAFVSVANVTHRANPEWAQHVRILFPWIRRS